MIHVYYALAHGARNHRRLPEACGHDHQAYFPKVADMTFAEYQAYLPGVCTGVQRAPYGHTHGSSEGHEDAPAGRGSVAEDLRPMAWAERVALWVAMYTSIALGGR